jgi:hypothetical protein
MTAHSKSCRDFLDLRLGSERHPAGVQLPAEQREGGPLIVPQVTQTKAEALTELRSLTDDEKWLARATAGLPE